MKILVILFVLFSNLSLSSLLYGVITEVFGLDTGGFLDFTPIFVACGSWMIVSLLGLVLSYFARTSLQQYYRTVWITEGIALALPLLAMIVVTALLFVSKGTNH